MYCHLLSLFSKKNTNFRSPSLESAHKRSLMAQRYLSSYFEPGYLSLVNTLIVTPINLHKNIGISTVSSANLWLIIVYVFIYLHAYNRYLYVYDKNRDRRFQSSLVYDGETHKNKHKNGNRSCYI